jgi:hypothetical protein
MMRGGLRKLRTVNFTTIAGQSAVGAASYTCSWNSKVYPMHSAAKAYSLMENVEQQAFFMEIANDENAYFDGKAPYDRDRAELSRDTSPVAFDTDLWWFGHLYIPRYTGTIGTGGKRPIIFQIHDTKDAGDANGMPPLVAFIYNGSSLLMQWAWSSQDPYAGSFTAGNSTIGTVEPCRWYTIVSRIKVPTGYIGGEVDVWLDGTQTVTYRGNLGTPNVTGVYEKFGAYRSSDTGVPRFAVCWATDPRLSVGTSLESLKTATKPDWVPSTRRSR